MKKTKDQFTVVCEGLFLNDTKPEKWAEILEKKNIAYFPWEAGVSFHYRILDDAGEPTGEVKKKTKKELWLFQAMGGKNAVGKYFRLEAEHGEIPANEGKPAKPYISVMPIAEVFSDGQARFLEPPKDGKINVPASTDKPKGPVAPAGPKAPASPAQPAKPDQPAEPATPAGPKPFIDPNTAKASGFFADLERPQSDGWWTMKTQIGFDGADACNVLDFAKHMAVLEISKMVYEGGSSIEEVRQDTAEAIDYWVAQLRPRLLASKFANIRERLSHYLTLCSTVDSLDKVLFKGWQELPESDFQALRSEAIDRVKVIKAQTEGGVFKGKITGTLQPEVRMGVAPPPPDDPVEEEIRAELEHPAAPIPPGPDKALVDSVVVTIGKFQEWKKLLAYWNTTAPALQAVEDIRQAMRLWVAEFFMKAEYQAGVDGIRESFPIGLMTPDLAKTLEARYQELKPF